MKKLILTVLILMMAVPAFAQKRGPLQNVFASWYSVTADTPVLIPSKSRDVYIRNGSTTAMCVSLDGSVTTTACPATLTDAQFQLDGDSDITLRDYVTDSIRLGVMSGTASPVSIVVTY